jgi:hypothetical protein
LQSPDDLLAVEKAMKPTTLIIVCVAALALWLLLRPTPLTPNPQLKTFAEVSGGAPGSVTMGLGEHVAIPHIEPGCVFPALRDTDKLVLVSAIRGQGISTATIRSQDVATTTATISIESGDTPLYLVILPVQTVIWRFTGAADRIRSLVFASGSTPHFADIAYPPLAGETGIPRDKVTFLPQGCLKSFTTTKTIEGTLAAGLLRNYVGRMSDTVLAGEAVSDFSIPSGTVTVTNPHSAWRQFSEIPATFLSYLGIGVHSRFGTYLDRQMNTQYPDGVIDVTPTEVIASDTVSAYNILPDLAGLQQLVREGAIQDMGSDEYHIKRQIRLPAELSTGGFLLLKGVPEPDGDPGKACIVSQETGQVLDKSRGRPLC